MCLRAQPPARAREEPVFDALARECRRIIAENRSTLFFVNSRRHAEKLARFINEGLPQPLAWSHHGSLSRELRLVVEQRLKQGELKAIVATSSLELGIDIGSLDQVILVQTPVHGRLRRSAAGPGRAQGGRAQQGRPLPPARQGHRGCGRDGAVRAGSRTSTSWPR